MDPAVCRDAHCVSLLTDFGNIDGYVGAVKGLLLSVNSRLTLVDLSHDIESHDVVQAAYVLGRHYRYFPRGTVHLAVVDPGVGGKRRGVVVESTDWLFVGPDNGIFSHIYDELEAAIFAIDEASVLPQQPSDLFHARDIFAPIAGRLTLGLPASEVGSPLDECVSIPLSRPLTTARGIEGHVIHVDRFGNMVTDIPIDLVRSEIGETECVIEVADRKIEMIRRSYDCVGAGELLAVFGSSGFLEISANMKNAAELLAATRGEPVVVTHR